MMIVILMMIGVAEEEIWAKMENTELAQSLKDWAELSQEYAVSGLFFFLSGHAFYSCFLFMQEFLKEQGV